MIFSSYISHSYIIFKSYTCLQELAEYRPTINFRQTCKSAEACLKRFGLSFVLRITGENGKTLTAQPHLIAVASDLVLIMYAPHPVLTESGCGTYIQFFLPGLEKSWTNAIYVAI